MVTNKLMAPFLAVIFSHGLESIFASLPGLVNASNMSYSNNQPLEGEGKFTLLRL